jgi:hypothetical protein
MTGEAHLDVAAYALGVLDDGDAARFEAHLVDCPTCAAELESMLDVVDVLAEVDADAIVAAEQSRRDGLMLRRMMGAVTQERRQARSRRLYTLAAAVVAFAIIAVGALFAGSHWMGNGGAGTLAKSTGPSELPALPIGGGQGGPETGGGQNHFVNTDPRTGVSGTVTFEKKAWGTHVNFGVGNVTGPRTCRLVAVRTDGQQEILSTWQVDAKGWGTAANPTELNLVADTALPRSMIARVVVQSVTNGGPPEQLVSVPE